MLTITVPRVPPSGNELRRQYRHWAAYKNLKVSWEQEFAYCTPAPIYKELRELCGCANGVGYKIHLHVRIGRIADRLGRPRLLDHDNAIAGLKPVLDALKNKKPVGFIWDDSPKWLDLHVEQFTAAKSVTEFTFSAVSNHERMRALGKQFEDGKRIITEAQT